MTYCHFRVTIKLEGHINNKDCDTIYTTLLLAWAAALWGKRDNGPPIRKQLTNQEWIFGIDNVYFSSLYSGCVVDQGYNLLTDIRESNKIDKSDVEYSKYCHIVFSFNFGICLCGCGLRVITLSLISGSNWIDKSGMEYS